VLEAGALLGKAAGLYRRHHAETPDADTHPTYAGQDTR
jgi:hypothetical protein